MGGSELFLFLFIVNFLVNNQAISAIIDSAGDYKQTWNANDQTKIFFLWLMASANEFALKFLVSFSSNWDGFFNRPERWAIWFPRLGTLYKLYSFSLNRFKVAGMVSTGMGF